MSYDCCWLWDSRDMGWCALVRKCYMPCSLLGSPPMGPAVPLHQHFSHLTLLLLHSSWLVLSPSHGGLPSFPPLCFILKVLPLSPCPVIGCWLFIDPLKNQWLAKTFSECANSHISTNHQHQGPSLAVMRTGIQSSPSPVWALCVPCVHYCLPKGQCDCTKPTR